MPGNAEEVCRDPHEFAGVPQIQREENDDVRIPVVLLEADIDIHWSAGHRPAIRRCGRCWDQSTSSHLVATAGHAPLHFQTWLRELAYAHQHSG